MKGTITRRGRNSWRLKYDLPRGADGRRRTRFETVRGDKKAAQRRLHELLNAVDKGTYVERSRVTVAEHVRARIDQWEKSGAIGAKTGERYRELAEGQIVPHLGHIGIQELKAIDIERWHTTLRTSGRKVRPPKAGKPAKQQPPGLSLHTIRGAHRVLSKALREAVRFDLAFRNPAGAEGQTAPRMAGAEEVEIIGADKLPDVIDQLRGRAIYPKAITALFTGLRRGELLALRWANVDLEEKVIRVREALEETKAHGVRVKAAKTRAGRRDVTLPDIVVEVLREHRRAQLEQRMALGAGRLPEEALCFPATDGGPQSPRNFSGDWREVAASIGLAGVSLHALRHSHASMLIDSGIDVVTISKRLGHASPAITLAIYAHQFAARDNKSAAAINAALAGIGKA